MNASTWQGTLILCRSLNFGLCCIFRSFLRFLICYPIFKICLQPSLLIHVSDTMFVQMATESQTKDSKPNQNLNHGSTRPTSKSSYLMIPSVFSWTASQHKEARTLFFIRYQRPRRSQPIRNRCNFASQQEKSSYHYYNATCQSNGFWPSPTRKVRHRLPFSQQKEI